MLELVNIKKDYFVDKKPYPALKGINLYFPKQQFCSILGPSGCGKTTTLNIIGGLDKYTSGDLIIEGHSTKEYNDKDWDNYRNKRIGFVFQSYNLIPHLSILENVVMSLTLNGLNRREKLKKGREALDKVGLKDLYNKRPNQLSGGQMQRVAIARAIIHDPEIILADEPTGALDSTTSIQIMDLLKEISKDKLIIMVTHNKELAVQYSDRIIEFKDGEVENDTQANEIQKMFNNEYFRVYRVDDLIGVEIGGSIKNVIALAAGMADGLGYGDNTKAALSTRGIAEIAGLAVKMGAKVETLCGLTGIGDLIVTCESRHSRNRKAGMLIGQGYTMQQAMDEVKMVVEGVYSAKAAVALAKKYGVEMPIIEEVNRVLFEDKPAKEAVNELMLRDKKMEHSNLGWEE